MASPVFTVDMAFGSKPTDAAYAWTNVHTDGGPSRVLDSQYQRGRSNELNRSLTANGSLLLGDALSDFDPNNPGGRFSANVKPFVPVRLQATIAGVTYPCFQHYVFRWPRTRRVAMTWTERSIATVDGFEWLAKAGLAGDTFSQELSGARFGHTLDAIGWPAALRNIDAGQESIQAQTFAASDSTKALQHLLSVADSENGMAFIDAQGRVRFIARQSLVTSPYNVSQLTLHDGQAGGSPYTFVDAVPSYDLDVTFNEWIITGASGNPQTAQDAASQLQNGVRTQTLSSLAVTDANVLAQAQWKTIIFGNPLNRLDSVTVKPGDSTAFWQAVLQLEVGSRITIREQPPGFAAPVATDYQIQMINVRVPKGPANQATFTFGLWPASLNQWIIWDDPVQGKWDSNRWGY